MVSTEATHYSPTVEHFRGVLDQQMAAQKYSPIYREAPPRTDDWSMLQDYYMRSPLFESMYQEATEWHGVPLADTPMSRVVREMGERVFADIAYMHILADGQSKNRVLLSHQRTLYVYREMFPGSVDEDTLTFFEGAEGRSVPYYIEVLNRSDGPQILSVYDVSFDAARRFDHLARQFRKHRNGMNGVFSEECPIVFVLPKDKGVGYNLPNGANIWNLPYSTDQIRQLMHDIRFRYRQSEGALTLAQMRHQAKEIARNGVVYPAS